MTLEQLLSPAVWDWAEANADLPAEQSLKEFNEWFINNEDTINESVKNNIESINECIKQGEAKYKLLKESDDFDDFDDFDDDESDKDKPITGEIETDDTTTSDEDSTELIEEPSVPAKVSKKKLKLMDPDKAKVSKQNVFVSINTIYNKMVSRKLNDKPNSFIWGNLDVSNVTDMTALFAFADIPTADLSGWSNDTLNVKSMEGMFYKSTFNNDSICGWDVSKCVNFLRMFQFSDFNQDISKWTTGYTESPKLDKHGNAELDSKGEPIMIKTRVPLPLLGNTEDEEEEMLASFWDEKFDEWFDEDIVETKKYNSTKNMKHILDYNTFINEGFGDFVKRGVKKVKSFFKNVAIKLGDFIAMFDKKGQLIEAQNPYTAINFISDGKVKGVTAYTSVENEYLNDNVQSSPQLIESPEYYGIVDKNSIEYRNFRTMIEMVNEHNSKFGNELNEANARIGFSAESGGIFNARDVDTKRLKYHLKNAMLSAPAYNDGKKSPSLLIWGAPGIGKSSIPNAIIEEWNKNNKNEQKALMVVECGDLTIDGFSLPMPTVKTIGQYLKEHPKAQQNLIDKGIDVSNPELLNRSIQLSDEAVKTWLPVYKKTADNDENITRNAIANGYLVDNSDGVTVTETTEGGIILFDEILRANENIFKILMQILLNRKFGGQYVFGDKWAIIACSNRPNDDDEAGEGYSHTGSVFGSRVLQLNFIPNFEDWKQWAITKGHFDIATIQFLTLEEDSNGEYTNWHNVSPDDYKEGISTVPVPRTWSMMMDTLHTTMKNNGYASLKEIPEDIFLDIAAGCIGMSMAQKYIEFIKTTEEGMQSEEVLNNPKYNIKSEIKESCPAAAAADMLKLYINAKFNDDDMPSDDQMMNMFNFMERTYNPIDQNVMLLYAYVMNRFGFFTDKESRKVFIDHFNTFYNSFKSKYVEIRKIDNSDKWNAFLKSLRGAN